ncbi:hypothetical protein [Streptodolium elevatio]
MEPIPAVLLGAVATGAGGGDGPDAWVALRALVRQASRRSGTAGDAALTALAQSPHDPVRAESLSQALAARAHMDPEFEAALTDWLHTWGAKTVLPDAEPDPAAGPVPGTADSRPPHARGHRG